MLYVGSEHFNNTQNGAAYPTVADPDGFDLNQLYFDIKSQDVRFRVGRQRINLDNQRFVGGVGWRQNEQTFDGLSLLYNADKVDINYAYVSQVNRIFGPKSSSDPGPAEELDANMHLLNAKIALTIPGNLSLYAYMMDLEDAPAASNQTLGIRYDGTVALENVKVPFAFEFAKQDDHGDNLTGYSANYLLAEVGLQFEQSTFKVGYEVLEGSTVAGKSFRTPLATGHKFHGWADKLLGTPTGGIEDVYVSFGQAFGANQLSVAWHNFEAETGNASYGSEIDASFSHKFNKRYSLLLKTALYGSDGHSKDTEKFWLMFTASF